MTQRIVSISASLIIIVVAFFAWKYWGGESNSTNKRPEPVVTVTTNLAKLTPWQSSLSAVAVLRAAKGINLSSQVAGLVDSVPVEAGQVVQQGTTLVEIKHNVEAAQLKNYQAKYKLAHLNYERQRTLYVKANTAKSEVDIKLAELQEAQASVEEQQAIIARKVLLAPFSGTIGTHELVKGQYITAGQSLLSLQSLDELYVDFTLPEQYAHLLTVGQDVIVSTLSPTPVIREGKLSAINVIANTQTHNIEIQAKIANPEHDILPGMAAEVKVLLPQQAQVISIPIIAIEYSLHGNSVYVVKPNKDKKLSVSPRYIKIGAKQADRVSIIDGLEAGEQIVTSGQLKLHNGSLIKIDNKQRLP